jgi:hypothetical protein
MTALYQLPAAQRELAKVLRLGQILTIDYGDTSRPLRGTVR